MTLANSSPAFEDCTFEGNTSLKHGGAGLLWLSGATFLRCRFLNNSAVEFGGALVMTGGSRPLFVASTFQGNTAGTGSTIGSGGAIHANDSSPTLRGCTVQGNQAKFAGGGIVVLGAAGSPNGTATLTVQDSIVVGNTASRATPSSNPAEGGGIHVEVNALGRIVRSRIRNNVANTGGGLNAALARYEIERSIVEGNQATDPAGVGGFGGGVQALSNGAASKGLPASSVVVTDSVVRNNIARVGGGLFINGDMTCGSCTDATARKATLEMTGSLVDGNTATDQGGGVYSNRGILTISGGLISRNTSNTGNGIGGGLATFASSSTFTAARIAANQASQLGGGVYADLNSTLSVEGSSIYRNTAGNTGGALYVGPNGTNGGTVHASALVDNVGTTIAEHCPASAPRLTYTSNTIVSSSTSTIYTGICSPPGSLTVLGLDSLPSGRASVNTGVLALATIRSLAYFAVTPDFFPAVLGWSVMRATGVSITPPVSPAPTGDTGTVDVDGIGTVDYSFSAGTPLGSVGPIVATAAPSPGAVNVTFASQPSGLTLSVKGTSVVTPATVASVEGLPITAVAPVSQKPGSGLYLFSSWDGLLQNTLTIATPSAPATYTARYQPSVDIGPLDFFTLQPCRLVDTRTPVGPRGGPALVAGSSRTFTAWNECDVPATARALILVVTATEATANGNFRIHPANQLVTTTSSVNFVPGVNRANNAVVALDGSGRFMTWAIMASGSVHLVIDVTGYFE
jgi:hypothetical protein